MDNRQIRSIIYLCISVISVVVITAISWNYFNKEKFITHVNKTHGFSLKYPNQWKIDTTKPGVPVIIQSPSEGRLDSFIENVNVVVLNIENDPMTLREYTNRAIEQLVLVFAENIEIVESIPTRLDDREAHKLVYVGGDSPDERTFMKIMHLWTIKDTTVYQFTYSASPVNYDKYWDDVQKMISSFEILR